MGSPHVQTLPTKRNAEMLEMLWDGFDWAAHAVTRFDMRHWAFCAGLLLAVGFLCMRGLGIRGAR